MNATIDDTLCTGCEDCCSSVPEVFQMNDSFLAEVIATPVPEALEKEVESATARCPMAAILLS